MVLQLLYKGLVWESSNPMLFWRVHSARWFCSSFDREFDFCSACTSTAISWTPPWSKTETKRTMLSAACWLYARAIRANCLRKVMSGVRCMSPKRGGRQTQLTRDYSVVARTPSFIHIEDHRIQTKLEFLLQMYYANMRFASTCSENVSQMFTLLLPSSASWN